MRIIRAIAALLIVVLVVPGAFAQENVIHPERVVSLHASYADAWLTAGGELVGVTDNAFAFSDRLANCGAENLGSHDKPNMELLFQLKPDYVILSADNQNHKEIGEILAQAGIAFDFYGATDWRDYMEMMQKFTSMTGREDLYQQQIVQVQMPIEACIKEAQALSKKPTALLLRAFSSGVRAKGSQNNVAGAILQDMGFENIADREGMPLENLSMEQIMLDDPDYIFVVTMGVNSDAALKALDEQFTGNPAWNTLTAVQDGRYIVLDRQLFHLHPNSRWAESYEFILSLLQETSE